MLMVVINKVAGTAEAGDFGLALAIVAPVFMFANLRFSTLLGSDMRTTIVLSDYFKLRALLVALAIGIIGCVSLALTLRSSNISLLLFVVGLVKGVEAFSDLCCGVQQRIESIDRIAVSLAINGVMLAFAFSLVYYLTQSLTLAALGWLAARCLVLVAYDIPMAQAAAQSPAFSNGARSDPTETRTRMWATLSAGIPLGVTAALVSLTTGIPRYVISAIHGDSILGLFTSVAVILQAGNLVFRAVEQPALPRLARLLEARDARGFWQLLRRLVGLFLLIGMVGSSLSWVCGSRLLSAIYNPGFSAMGGVLAAMVLAGVLAQIAGMIESSLIAARLTTQQVPMHAVTAISCLALCCWFVPSHQLYGAVLAVTVCRFPFVVIGVWLLRQKLAEPPVGGEFASRAAKRADRGSVEREAA